MLYSDWCSACKAIKPLYREMAEEGSEKMPKLVFAKYNAELNHERVKLEYYPTLVLF